MRGKSFYGKNRFSACPAKYLRETGQYSLVTFMKHVAIDVTQFTVEVNSAHGSIVKTG